MLQSFPSERRTDRDRKTGVTVHQLTTGFSHSYHLYFTNPGWWDAGRRLLFASDRGNCQNLYSIDLESFEITRLTDNAPLEEVDFQGASVNPTRAEGYFWRGGKLYAINLRTGTQRHLFTEPAGFGGHGTNVTADGKFVCCVMRQHTDVGPTDLGAGYVGFREIFESHPLCRILRVPADGSNTKGELLHEERNWLGHINTSPKHPHLLTFCYEGPWQLVGQRMWVLDMKTGQTWKLREQTGREMIGHEYWMADGDTIGYHGKIEREGFFGYTRWDNTGRVELPFPHDSNHFHSNDTQLIVADGPAKDLTPYVLLSRFDGQEFDGPRVLCTHRGSRHIQHLHVHPRFTPDGRQVLYTADPRGYGQLFLAEIPPFEQLVPLDQLKKKQMRDVL